MAKLEEIKPGVILNGIVPDYLVKVVSLEWFGSECIELTYKEPTGKVDNKMLWRSDELEINIAKKDHPWSFDGNGELFRLVSEAHRIRLAHLFDPVLAVHTSLVDPLPHQITAVYESMLPRQPLRFLLADDPGAGKTIMAGLLIKELIARGDLHRCLVVCPGSLAEQWQDELFRRFHLPFEILTNDKLESARTGNWFLENNLVIARLDKLARNEDLQQKLQAPECGWDLVICDEAHKLAATFFGGEIKYTKRYKLGQLLSGLTRHFLLMTATPHNGKEEDFQLFLALLDNDRFEGRFRDGVHQVDTSDLMRRMVKEKLLKFNGQPLFPERKAHTVPYKLTESESVLYNQVTKYVQDEFNRAEKLNNDKRSGTVGFALTILQRRLASSPEAIHQSLRRRRERLEKRLNEILGFQKNGQISDSFDRQPTMEIDDWDDLDEAPEAEVETIEEEILDLATAARSIEEYRAEIETLRHLEALAQNVLRLGDDRKWKELAGLLNSIFSSDITDSKASQKLVIFTEHRDTLNYLYRRISTLIGRPSAIVLIHGAMGREDRLKAQDAFRHDPEVHVLIATDAAGEGINLQNAHLMVNYDLPWNPNRLEQRFGRIHRIGQTEVCHLWNLVAEQTREGEVYLRLLEKLEQAREALGGQVFDVLGQLQFEGRPLRDLLVEAIRYGELPEVKARLNKTIENSVDRSHVQELLEKHALARDTMDVSRVAKIREDMERAEARKLQPCYIQSFFLEAFRKLGGTIRERESRRFEITHVPAFLKQRNSQFGRGDPIQTRYERIAFDKQLVNVQGLPSAAFICPGHPLLDASLDLMMDRNSDLLRRGCMLIDENDPGVEPRVLFYLEHAIQDASRNHKGDRRTISKRMLYVELYPDGQAKHLQYAPYLDYRPLRDDELDIPQVLELPECQWITKELERTALTHAIKSVVPEHLDEVRKRQHEWINKTKIAVKDRLSKEISYWDRRAQELKEQEYSGKINAKVNSQEAQRRADQLQARLQRRIAQLDNELKISASPPIIVGGLVVIPAGLLAKINKNENPILADGFNTQIAAAKARAVIMRLEKELGCLPVDREFDKLGYDIESLDPITGQLRFIEVKGRAAGSPTITMTKNEVLYSLNKPEDFILAIVEFCSEGQERVYYIRKPCQKEPDFGVTSVNYNLDELIARAELPANTRRKGTL